MGVVTRSHRVRTRPVFVLGAALLVLLQLQRCSAADAGEGDEDELTEVRVNATRTPELMKDEPLHVEAVPSEEIEENLTESPGDVIALFRELPGIHVQSSAAGLGGARMQLRGMPSQDTLLLMDGLPLSGAEPDAFGLLQTPPLDLAQAEVIKGASSALYGASALSGVLNLVSRPPSAESTLLLNANSRGGRDASAFLTEAGSASWSGTLSAAADTQSRQDGDDDGWTDVPFYQRYSIRPRIYWKGSEDETLFLTGGFTHEDRDGGTAPGAVLPDGSSFPESLRTERFDAGAVSHWGLQQQGALTGRFSFTSNRQDSSFGSERVSSTLSSGYGEEAWSGGSAAHQWVLGAGFEHDELTAPAAPGVSYSYNVPALFAQDEYRPLSSLTLAGSARLDAHNRYGTFFSPRLSALLRRPHSPWSLRLSAGTGFSAPTPLLEEVESTSLAALLPLKALTAERATTASVDGAWANEGWQVNLSLFSSQIRHPLEVVPAAANRLELINGAGVRQAPGAELLIGYAAGPWEAIASWAHIEATERSAPQVPHRVPLVPRDGASLDGILHSDEHGRIGLELEYTGRQQLEDDPYRSIAPGYFELNALAEIRFGQVRIFLNALNLTDVHQSSFDPLLRPSAGPGGNPITEVWAPLVGRTFNLGVRLAL